LIVEDADGTDRHVVLKAPPASIRSFAVSPDGVWLAYTTIHDDVLVRKLEGHGTGDPITVEGSSIDSPTVPSWSPDGSRLGFVMETDAGQRDVVVVDVAERLGHVLTETPEEESAVAWSPNGRWLAVERTSTTVGCEYAGAPFRFQEIYRMRPDGSHEVNMTADKPWNWRLIDWTPRGLLSQTFNTDSDGDVTTPCGDGSDDNHLFQPRRGRDHRLPSHHGGRPLALSPDRSSYLYSRFGDTDRMWKADVDGSGKPELVTRNARFGDWFASPDR
jgi:dipeptidyl aminopeptidase/acylaminoacyl peptidase